MRIHFSANLSEAQQAEIQQLFQQFQHETLQQNLLALNAIKKWSSVQRFYALSL